MPLRRSAVRFLALCACVNPHVAGCLSRPLPGPPMRFGRMSGLPGRVLPGFPAFRAARSSTRARYSLKNKNKGFLT